MVFGRRSSCDVTFKDDLVSGFHCKIHINSKGIFVEDMKASNPLQINGIGISSGVMTKIEHHDSIRIGSSEYVLYNCEARQDDSYKTMVLERVKVHEAMDSDKDYKKYQSRWQRDSDERELEEKQRKKIKSIRAKVKVLKESHQIIESLKKEYTELQSKKDEVTKNVDEPSKYNLNELKEHIDLYDKKINELKEKKKEIVKIYNNVIVFKESSSQIHNLKKRILELQEKFDEEEFKKLSGEYDSAITDLNKIKKKAS
jgi:pSer/pThr/pTyr-binding forkhead associated (FHA) protein